jgi:hypothetical protein
LGYWLYQSQKQEQPARSDDASTEKEAAAAAPQSATRAPRKARPLVLPEDATVYPMESIAARREEFCADLRSKGFARIKLNKVGKCARRFVFCWR